MIFVVVNYLVQKAIAFADGVDGWEFGAIGAKVILLLEFAIGAESEILIDDVIFTTLAKWGAEMPATPARMGCDKV